MKNVLLAYNKLNFKSYSLNTVYLWISFATVIIRTDINKRVRDVVQSSPFHQCTRDHSILSHAE